MLLLGRQNWVTSTVGRHLVPGRDRPYTQKSPATFIHETISEVAQKIRIVMSTQYTFFSILILRRFVENIYFSIKEKIFYFIYLHTLNSYNYVLFKNILSPIMVVISFCRLNKAGVKTTLNLREAAKTIPPLMAWQLREGGGG